MFSFFVLFFCHFYKDNFFCDFLFASLYPDLLIQERIHFPRSKFFPVRCVQGLTNPLPGRPGQAPIRAGQVLFPARRPAGQVKENFKQLKFGEIYSKCA